jgi:dihydrofolate reductase
MLFGRRMYDLLAGYWPGALDDPAATPAEREYAELWRAIPKVVFSDSLEAANPGDRLVRGDALAEIARIKAATGGELSIGGPTIAGSALRAGLLDEVRLYVNPVLLGTGLPFFPSLDAPVSLVPRERTEYASGVVRLRYDVRHG